MAFWRFSIPPYMVPNLNCFWPLDIIQSRSSTPELSGRALVIGMAGFGIKKLSVPNALSWLFLRKSAVVAVGGTSLYRKYNYNSSIIVYT